MNVESTRGEPLRLSLWRGHAPIGEGRFEQSDSWITAALQRFAIPCHYLELPSGGHGLDGYQGPMWDAWQSGALKWLAEMHNRTAT
jgi:hypothetical protein